MKHASIASCSFAIILAGCTAGDSEELGLAPADEAFEAVSAAQAPAPPLVRSIVHCASQGYRYETCPVHGQVLSVSLLREVSLAPCVEGRSWGYEANRGFIWVDHGCRADFAVDREDPDPGPGPDRDRCPPGQSPRCGYDCYRDDALCP